MPKPPTPAPINGTPAAPASPAAAEPAAKDEGFDRAFDQIAADTPEEAVVEDALAAAPAKPKPAKKKPDEAPDQDEDDPAPLPDKPAKDEEDGADPGDESEADAHAEADEKPPEGLTEKAKERFTEILGDRKELRTENAKLKENFSELSAWVKETGATPEEFQQQVDRLRVFKTGKPDELKSLRTDLLEAVKDITVRLGDDAPGFDPLEGFADLQKDVEDMKLTTERAREIALGRRSKARADRINTETSTRTAEQQKQEAHRSEVTAANAEIRKLEAGWKKVDPDADRKVKTILAGIEDFKYIPPKLWAATVKKRYEALSGLAPQRPGHVQRPVGGTRTKPGAQAEPATLGALMDSMVER